MQEKGQIVYIGGFEMPDKNAAAQRVSANAKAFRELGYQVVFIGVSKIESDRYEKNTFFGFDCYAQEYPCNSIAWFKYITCFQYYINIINRYNNVKAIVCYNLSAFSLYRLLRWAKKHNIKIIADCTEWYEVPSKERLVKKTVKRLDVYARMNILHAKLDAVIVISRYLEDYYKNKGVKTVNIPPLVDMEDDKWKIEAALEADGNIIEVAYVGSPFSLGTGGQKDRLDYLVRFFSNNSDSKIKLKIVGVSEREFLGFYPDFSVDTIKSNIQFHGRKTHLESIEILKGSDFSIFLRDETLTNKAGFPTKFVEAITAGIPVLTNKSSNICDFLLHGENGFWLDLDNYDAFSQSLIDVLVIDKIKINKIKTNIISSELFFYKKYLNEFKLLLD